MIAAAASILRDTSTGLLSSAMVQSSLSLCLCTLRLHYRAHLSGFMLDVVGLANYSSIRNSHSDRFEVSRFPGLGSYRSRHDGGGGARPSVSTLAPRPLGRDRTGPGASTGGRG